MEQKEGTGRTGKKKRGLLDVILWLGFTAVTALLVFPSAQDAWYRIRQSALIGGYERQAQDMGEDRMSELWEEAVAYNREVREAQKRKTFSYQGETATDDTYEHILEVTPGSEVMASVEIPAIGITLPVSRGTKSQYLRYEAGHMYGTSVPVGGQDTHCVIAAHSGLKSADLFTHLDRLTAGDPFYIHVLGKTLKYTVDAVNVVLPDEEDSYLQIADGQDFVTLYTCTPYGINSHRLLVRGVFTETVESGSGGSTAYITQISNEALTRFILLCIIPLIVFAAGCLWYFQKGPFKGKAPGGRIGEEK